MKRFAAVVLMGIMLLTVACAETTDTEQLFLGFLRTEISAPDQMSIKPATLLKVDDSLTLNFASTMSMNVEKRPVLQDETMGLTVDMSILYDEDLLGGPLMRPEGIKDAGENIFEGAMNLEFDGFKKQDLVE